MDKLGDRLLLTYHRLVEQRILLEELAHLTLGDLLQNSLGFVGILRILLHGLDSDLALVLDHIGRLVKWKRVDLLIDAFTKVIASHPDAELVVVGDGPELDNLKKPLFIQEKKKQ